MTEIGKPEREIEITPDEEPLTVPKPVEQPEPEKVPA